MAARGINIDRVSVKVSPDQIAWLNEAAKTHATSVSDVIRRLIDETMGAYITPARGDTRHNAEGQRA
jgi:hypothetical protein